MAKFLKVIQILGIRGGILLVLYKYLYPKLQAFKSSLEIIEWSDRKKVRIDKSKDGVRLMQTPGFESKSFELRPFTSDSMVFRQHFFGHELAPIVEYFKNKRESPSFMIDAGGNIGAAACYMQWNFPGLRSLILEPSEENAKLAELNLKELPAKVWRKALWWRSETLSFDDKRSAWAMRVSENSGSRGTKVIGVSLSEILSNPEFKNPDYIKIDIEGSEEVIFEKDEFLDTTLHRTSCISIEPHSEYGHKLISDRLLAMGFRVEYHGELIIGFR